MSQIDRFMPRSALRQVDHEAVAAAPERAFAAARTLDAYRVPFIRMLFNLRLLPEHFTSLLLGRQSHVAQSSRIDDFTRPGSGFVILAEEPGHEIVIGSIGKFWRPRIEYASVTPEQFASFSTPGFGRLAWSIRIDPRQRGGSWATFDLRVGATDPGSFDKFKRYWRFIGPFSHRVRRGVLHTLVKELGAVDLNDDEAPLAGDELLLNPRFRRTQVKVIEASTKQVWPWLVQMGARLDKPDGRGGEELSPELQRLQVGDFIPALPRGHEGFAVLAMEPGRHLVVGSPSLLPGGGPPVSSAPPYRTTWAFVLEPIGDLATRLLFRVRAEYQPSARMALARARIASTQERLELQQLRQLKRRVEAHA